MLTSPLKYNPAFDGLRCIAVTSVVLFHINEKWIRGGWIGVEVFFVLSGFLITRILAREIGKTGRVDLRRFYVRRAIRLMPALVLMLSLLLPVSIAMDQTKAFMKGALLTCTYLMNWARAFNVGNQWYLGHTWSLAIEEQFYLVWPVAFLAVRKRPVPWIFAMLISIFAWRAFLVLNEYPVRRTYNGFDTHADTLIFGCLIAIMPTSTWLVRRAADAAPMLALILVAMVFCLDGSWNSTRIIGIPFIGLISAGLIFASQGKGWFHRLLSLRPLTFTGKISYGWYLWHYPILLLVAKKTSSIFALILAALLAYFLAAMSYIFVEKKLLFLKNLPIAR